MTDAFAQPIAHIKTEDEAMQSATQQDFDPRQRRRNASDLNDEDMADVLAILHPASPNAIKILEHTVEACPEYVLFRRSFDSCSSHMEEQGTIIIGQNDGRFVQGSHTSADLVLRMSAAKKLKFPNRGFVFGRYRDRSDIVFYPDSEILYSRQHFRIYLNSDAILMIEDISTNGTLVDDHLLKNRNPRLPKVRMLNSGSIITLATPGDAEAIKFVVRIPSRDSHMDRFQKNIRKFLTECATGEERAMSEEKAMISQRRGKRHGGPTMKWDGGARYNIIGLIGEDSLSAVYLLATKTDGKLLAAKKLEKQQCNKGRVDNEMRIMQSIRHPNIVEFVEHHDQGDFVYIIMEFVRYGDLQGYLKKNGPMKEPLVRTMAQQILSALSYIHQSKIAHRDVKPDNILIANLDPFEVKLSDFGLSKIAKHDETLLETFCGTLLYLAPEVYPDYNTMSTRGTKRRRGYNSSIDIWSFAAMLWCSLCSEPPFRGIVDGTGKGMYDNIINTRLDPGPLRKAGVSETCIDFLFRMLQTDPTCRATERECLDHPWLNDSATIPANPTFQSIAEEDESDEAERWLSELSTREKISEYSRCPSPSALAEACGWQNGLDKFLWDRNTETELKVDRELGRGISGDVFKVTALESTSSMAQKIVYIRQVCRRADEQRAYDEVKNMRKLFDHPHVIKVLGCYTALNGRFVSLMYPVGDYDLAYFLSNKEREFSDVSRMRKWFSCLASALFFIHAQNIRHDDIKPQNIICRNTQIFFTDFSSCREMLPGHTSTETAATGTRLYAAPEAMPGEHNDFETRHGTKSDVFALGMVFAEMYTIVQGETVLAFHKHLFGSKPLKPYWSVTDRFSACYEVINPNFTTPCKNSSHANGTYMDDYRVGIRA
ncbi:kinase-like protein [Byssothecium circinans]|uniref:non-specific serine/threonine protein kinase n=1 Tax=Byssothecium circinans TaxID=147558 RepID=A0A6A5TCP4_9PLEO|nr:kinase-like protein [Byssothecium circinans]